MKNIILLGILCAGISAPAYAHDEIIPHDRNDKKTVKKHRLLKIALYSAVGIGALYSFKLWFPIAMNAPARYPQLISPVTAAILPRLALDIATIGVCLVGLADTI